MAPVHARRVPLRTLALHLGTREMGYAVFEGSDLLYFGVHTFPRGLPASQRWTDGQRFLTEMITTFTPQRFVMEKPSSTASTRPSLLHVFAVALQRTARQHGLHVTAYASTTVKKAITGSATATKREVARTLIQRYPYLARYLRTDLRTKEKYWEHMFDAVASGLTGYEDTSKKRALHQTVSEG